MKNKSKIIAVIILVVMVAAAITAYFTLRPSGQADVKSLSVIVVHGDGSEAQFPIKLRQRICEELARSRI